MAHDYNESTSHVLVLGGGIAGIAAALELLDAGRRVTLVEARNFLGGRAFSFTDSTTGLTLDNGQHVIVGCCVQFIDLLERLGVRRQWFLQERLRIPVRDRAGRTGLLAASRLPAPMHLLPSFIAYPHMGMLDKLRAIKGMLRARTTDRSNPRLEDITFYQWLRENGQSERAISNLWNLVVEPTLNDSVTEVSASMGLMIVQEGMLASAHSANLGYATGGLLSSLGRPARRSLEEGGARLILGDPVRSLALEPGPGGSASSGRVTGVELASGLRLSVQHVISALPFSALAKVLPREACSMEVFRKVEMLQWSPILNLHILYDRPVMREPFCAFVDSPLQWVFNHNSITGAQSSAGGQLLTVSVSAAWEFIDLPGGELREMFIKEIAEVFPEAREAAALDARVVKQREATFRCLPGTSRIRPDTETPVSNLFLAGEWTNTGWPSTMEGAVRSGRNAARAVISNSGQAANAEGI